MIKIWTYAYRPLIMGGKCYGPVGCNINVVEEISLGREYLGYEIISPSGKHIIVEKLSGAIVGTSLDEVKNDIETGDPNVMAKQVKQACEEAQGISTVSEDEFWRLYRA